MSDDEIILLSEIDSNALEEERRRFREEGGVIGQWRWRPDDQTIERIGGYGWCVDVNSCRTPEQVLGWLGHVLIKTWATPEVVGDLVRVLHLVTGATERWGNGRMG